VRTLLRIELDVPNDRHPAPREERLSGERDGPLPRTADWGD
jgi:hypothetical protein